MGYRIETNNAGDFLIVASVSTSNRCHTTKKRRIRETIARLFLFTLLPDQLVIKIVTSIQEFSFFDRFLKMKSLYYFSLDGTMEFFV